MKSPADLAGLLARQWENPDTREARLTDGSAWPVRLAIGRPPARAVADDSQAVGTHIRAWRAVGVGRVVWEPVAYRATGEPVEVPTHWEIADAEDWPEAAQGRAVKREFGALRRLLASSPALFHPLLIRQRAIWRDKPLGEVIQAARVASRLEPGCAAGAPLRGLSVEGIDTKFFERHRGLLLRLLDLRFDGEPSRQGLEAFLDAWQEHDSWLLLADLDGHLLSFPQLRVRGGDLARAHLTVPNLLLVENERCLHLVPPALPGTVAVLGAGNNLQWLAAAWAQRARVAYWGDIDTWGLQLLARARAVVPDLTAVLMTREVFDAHGGASAVPETVTAGPAVPVPLHPREGDLYRHLLSSRTGRLEQEFLPRQLVHDCLAAWRAGGPALPTGGSSL